MQSRVSSLGRRNRVVEKKIGDALVKGWSKEGALTRKGL